MTARGRRDWQNRVTASDRIAPEAPAFPWQVSRLGGAAQEARTSVPPAPAPPGAATKQRLASMRSFLGRRP